MLSTSISGFVPFVICCVLLLLTGVQGSPASAPTSASGAPSHKAKASKPQRASSSSSTPASIYPPPDLVPSLDSPEVQQWLQEVDLSQAPNIPSNKGEPPTCGTGWTLNPKSCYTPCQECSADDVVTCPDQDVWGLTFDDGPSKATPALLQFLEKKQLKATFFLIGGNVVQFPELAKKESESGHHLASHTWSHHPLTTLTNQQIVAEMKWTEKAIMDATGHKVRYMRPPYGDVDNRVRFVLKQMGYVVVDWSDTFDTLDWQIPLHHRTRKEAEVGFQASIQKYLARKAAGKPGFISLEHDLADINVDLAQTLITYGANNNLTIRSIADCLHDPNPYAAINYAPGVNGVAVGSIPPSSTPKSDTDGLDLPQYRGKTSSTSSGGLSRFSPRQQHFLGNLFFGSRASAGTADGHNATRFSRWLVAVERISWSGAILVSFVAGLASL
ncbi:peptidoglycan-N-acetylglucosamine deacetylase [Entomortierella parvispora]|uniref:Peptidoglycan-N-acetylglucosamine deacetylase n=1 Tax=Entomortierella parvispora TaxID=205924 RepID=A0A9P3LYD3_9FUNG|nr:peptidoglycan-N-acetylglucosamine deacetylase [Entomortierella parvispora]